MNQTQERPTTLCTPRGPRRGTQQRECGPAMTARYICRVLGKPEPFRSAQDRIKYERTMRRIMREGA